MKEHAKNSTEKLANPAVCASAADLIQMRHYAGGIDMSSGLVRSKQTGNRISAFKGRGMDYEESRRYQHGDDRRNLDWRVMARTGKPYTKLFREERERPVYLCLDLSPSMHFATHGQFKAVVAAKSLALLGWAAFGHGDRVGGVVFGAPDRLERRPTRGKRAILNWIHDVSRPQNWLPESFAESETMHEKLARISRVNRPGSLLAIASDWRSYDQALERQMMKLAQHNTLILFFIYDSLERELPPPGVYPVTAGGQVRTLDSRGRERRKRYAEEFDERQSSLRKLAAKMQATYIQIATHEDPVQNMLQALR